ncbi:MAG: glycine--tRNA ligase subunit beta [Deltaproteobacteria bacterium]|nr:glycine--tRNA ligase subunit beta [Deltaproteobacteria bacterium]
MPADLLFEIGCEEIPAKMLARALEDLPRAVKAKLDAARLEHKAIKALGTPRRLAVIVKGLAERQPDLREEVVGPPVGAAFAPDGSLTKAGQGFAAKNGVDASQIAQKEVPGKKGLYAVASRHVVGGETRALLPELLRDVAAGIAWPKSQRWGWTDVTFVRPVQWLVALYGGEVVPLTWAGQTAGRNSRGHRFLANTQVEIANADAYASALRAAHVIVDPEARKTEVLAEIKRIEGETGLRVRPDDTLLAEVINLGEYPVGVSGEFDRAFLEVPEEMIVTAMRNHQRYFAMEDKAGKLANRFTTMMATVVKDPTVVRKGNERVLASRLSDAKFFFGEDKKHGFDFWNKKLDAVVFQAKLGDSAKTIGQKVRRIRAIVEMLGGSATALRAAELCKADLASGAVGEFPELQGIMGKHYAVIAGESAQVAACIEEHWWPKGQGAALPRSADAALVALADRIDTLVGCFATGLIPSGNADPLGLRRAAIGVLSILLAREDGPASVDLLIDAAVSAYGSSLALSSDARTQLDEFFRARLRGVLVDEEGLDAQAVDVALAVGAANPGDARARARALAVVPADVRAAFKRIGNILDDARAKGFGTQPQPQPAVFTADVERNLWNAFAEREQAMLKAVGDKRYRDSFEVLAALGPPLAAFFDKGGVMVMDPKPELRENRLALLHAIYDPFVKIGDFRKLGGAS